jgi:uncharacterized flavoprotein (TIGR03862 family)
VILGICDALIVGGGPAGLRAAEIISASGWQVVVADRMPSVGRKFLVAGRGGLNLTHSEPLEQFQQRYGEPQERWRDLLAGFSPQDLRAWAKELGIETFVGTSRRVFPVGKQAAPLLRRWLGRLRGQGVVFQLRSRFTDLRANPRGGWEIDFETPEGLRTWETRAVIFALGGASWPQTGSDGKWFTPFSQAGILITPLAAANVGYEVEWSAEFLTRTEGLPLKNVVVKAGVFSVAGELLITKYGLEGGALYQLGAVLRGMARPEIVLDLKPSFTVVELAQKIPAQKPSLEQISRAWKLSPAATELLRLQAPFAIALDAGIVAKALRLGLRGPRPIEEAISSAGGVAWDALDENLMVKSHPGIFCAGEMIAWEAPTGGYLLQGCFATGTRAAQGAAKFLQSGQSR